MNVDFADVRAIMANAGSSLMGIGTATGMYVTANGAALLLLSPDLLFGPNNYSETHVLLSENCIRPVEGSVILKLYM